MPAMPDDETVANVNTYNLPSHEVTEVTEIVAPPCLISGSANQ